MFRALNDLPHRLGTFLPCKIGGNHCGLRYTGWEQSGRGLTSSPRETADPRALSPLLLFFLFVHLGHTLNFLLGPSNFATIESLLRRGSPHGLSQLKELLHCIFVFFQLIDLVLCLVWLEELEACLALEDLEVACLLSTLEVLEVI